MAPIRGLAEKLLRCFTQILLISGIFCSSVSARFIITHAPSHVAFMQDAATVQTSEIPDIISSSYGFQLNKDIQWNGLAQGSLFKRPKANVVFALEGVESDAFNVENIGSYNTEQDVPELDTESVVNHIQSIAAEKQPLILDFSIDNNIFDVRSHYPGLFRQVPASYGKIREAFLAGEFDFSLAQLGSLNATHQADLLFLGELHIIRKIVQALKNNPESVKGPVPDFYHFKVRGLSGLVEKYGKESSQAQDGTVLLQDVIKQLTEQFRELYKDNVVVQVVTMPTADRHEFHVVRKSRSLLQDGTAAPPTADYNLATNYDEMYPVVFNIILWLMIILTVSMIGIAYGIWNMDPGRDSIIYRMTSTRMKKD